MSYESEERYWTDYLRVALPVIGLLLMLALFWWWAQQFIGDENSPEDIARETETAEIATVAVPTATNTVEVVVQPTQDTTQPTEDAASDNGGNEDGTPGPDNGGTEDCGFAKGDYVVVTEGGVNIREEPALGDEFVIGQLEEGTRLVLVEDCYREDDQGNQFWRVRNEETAQTGYVSSDYLEADSGDE